MRQFEPSRAAYFFSRKIRKTIFYNTGVCIYHNFAPVVIEVFFNPKTAGTEKKTMGPADRIIRTFIAIGIGILYLTHVISGIFAIVLGIFAVIFVITSFFDTCLVYLPFGISICKRKETITHNEA